TWIHRLKITAKNKVTVVENRVTAADTERQERRPQSFHTRNLLTPINIIGHGTRSNKDRGSSDGRDYAGIAKEKAGGGEY
ncbi:hypothetical protein A2U01_0070837, partial [Trifolium medium]|nr:hypothetical protein [Trifolium medium]